MVGRQQNCPRKVKPKRSQTVASREKSLGVGWDSLKVSFHSLYWCSSCCPTSHLSWSYPESFKFSIVPSSLPLKCGWRQHCLRRLFGFWGIQHYQRSPSIQSINGNQCDHLKTTTIFVIPQTQNIAGGEISGFERKAFTPQNFPNSKVFGFKVPNLDCGFKISGDMTKPGCFPFVFVLSCVNGKTNLVLKRSVFITNPEQFLLV